VRLPGHIYIHRVETIDGALASCPPGHEFQEACVIWQHLAWLLIRVHDRGIVLRDLKKCNVVRARTEGGGQWTLLEFGNATRPGAMALSVTARTSPPEVRHLLVCIVQLLCHGVHLVLGLQMGNVVQARTEGGRGSGRCWSSVTVGGYGWPRVATGAMALSVTAWTSPPEVLLRRL
jgi:hypothetical protein